MKVTSILPAFLLPLSALATPVSGLETAALTIRDRHDGPRCVNKGNAQQVVDVYAKLIGDYDADTANKYLADDFADYSDSINTFIGKPLGSETFDKAGFMAAQAANPKIPITVEKISVVDCNSIALIWHMTFGAGNSVRGLSSLEVACDGDGWKFSRFDVEFNSVAWLLNVGGGYTLNGHKFGNVQC